jgi:hypothetical protein
MDILQNNSGIIYIITIYSSSTIGKTPIVIGKDSDRNKIAD